MSRQLVVDTETTGLDPDQGHRVIEIGCVELINRKRTHNDRRWYINPEREIDAGAFEVHGISAEFLADKPVFDSIAEELAEYLRGAELIIHNAPFDVAFLNAEFDLTRLVSDRIEQMCTVFDTLVHARKVHPGSRNSLDALCKRYFVDNTERTLHGALLDAEILSDVYLAMTGGQTTLDISIKPVMPDQAAAQTDVNRRVSAALKVIPADEAECDAHAEWLAYLEENADDGSVWKRPQAPQ